MSTGVIWSKSDVEFQYGGRLGEFNGMSSQSHTAGCCHLANSMSWFQSYVSHCRVLPPGEFNVMFPELCVTLQGAATWWIHCHNPTATCYIAGCSHLAKSMSWSCHIVGCKNSSCHRFSHILFFVFNAVWALTSGSFRIISNTFVLQWWGKQISDLESHGTRAPPKVNQFFLLVGPITTPSFSEIFS